MTLMAVSLSALFLFSFSFISAQNLIIDDVPSENVFNHWNTETTGNESILWGSEHYVWKEGIKICAVNSDFSDVDVTECSKYYENGTCDKYKDVKYKYPSKVKIVDKFNDTKLELDIPGDATDGCLTFPLNPLEYLWYKIGDNSIVISGVTGYNATFTNTTEEDGSNKLGAFAHLNTSDNSLVAYYPFDVLDGNGTWVTGNWSGALEFDGVNDYIDIGEVDTGTSLTYSLWVKPNVIGVDNNLLSNSKTLLRLTTGGALRYYPDVDTTVNNTGAVITNGVWNHVVVTQNSSNYFNIYVNGNNVLSGGTAPIDMTGIVGYIGRYATISNFNGSLDEVRIFDYALNSTEISELYTSNTITINPENETNGVELVTNGGFDNASWWSLGTGWEISGGMANSNSSSSGFGIYRTEFLEPGEKYIINYTVSNLSQGGYYAWVGSTTQVGNLNTNGSISFTATCGAATYFYIVSNGGVGSIDNVSVQKVGNQRGYWSLDETEGLVARDTSGNHNDGDLTGYGDDTRYTYDYTSNNNDGTIYGNLFQNTSEGYYGGAYEFDGVNDNILTSDSDSLDIATNNMSISVWFKGIDGEQIDTYPRLLCKGDVTNGYDLYFDSSAAGRRLRLGFNNNYYVLGAGNYLDGEWHNVVVILNRFGNAITYIDGGSYGSVDISSSNETNYSNTNGLRIATSKNGADRFKGSIDEVMIFNRSLSQTEIEQIYNSTFSRFYPTGEMQFTGLNFSSNNTLNITLDNCQTLNGSYLQGKINSGDWKNFTGCSFTDYDFTSTENDNFTTRFLSTPYNFYSPLIQGNITLDSWFEEIITNRTTINTNPLQGIHHFGYNYLPYRPSAFGEMQILENNGTTISFASEDVYVNVWQNQTMGHLQSVLFNNGTLTIQKSGYYYANSMISFRGQSGSTHGFALGINEVKQDDCYSQRKLGSNDVGTTGFSCIVKLNNGDKINLLSADEDATQNDIMIASANLNIHREG